MVKLKRLYVGTIVLISFFTGILGGVIGSRFGIEERVDKIIREQKIELRITKYDPATKSYVPVEIPDKFSKEESFSHANGGLDYSILESKVGFKYPVDETIKVQDSLFPAKSGAEYKFSVKRSAVGKVYERLLIQNYISGVSPVSDISLSDKNNDGILDDINISDELNGTSVRITRIGLDQPFIRERLFYDGVNEEGARELFDHYCGVYNKFKREHDIDRRILSSAPKLIIHEVHIGSQ